MTEKSSQTPLPFQGWTFLARGEQANDTMSRCPGGHIHLDYGYLTVRFKREEFLALARMVAEAVLRLQGVSTDSVHHLSIPNTPITFSLN